MRQPGKTLIVGLQGGQGTGKTTIVEVIKKNLRGYNVHSFSIDDFYTSYQDRQKLAKKYKDNPFYQIARGMPGTHRVDYLLKTLQKIRQGKPFQIPVFDKSLRQAQGDISKKTIKVTKRQDFILFEGWCVGLPTVSSAELINICKKTKIDLPKGNKVVLKHIKEYQPLWKYLDYMVMIKPDSSEVHKEWRSLQEKRLREKKGEGLSKEQISKFVDIYLPFTYVCYEKIRPDAVIKVDQKHEYYRIVFS